jgi:Tol biopolymer transport system component
MRLTAMLLAAIAACGDNRVVVDASTIHDTPPPDSPVVGLTVTILGVGAGSVSSDVGGITCANTGGTCTAELAPDTSVTLTAAAAAGYVFAGWRGAGCHGTAPCALTLSQSLAVEAVFAMPTFQSRRAVDGSDAASPHNDFNVWTVRTDGTGLQALTTITAASVFSNGQTWSPDGSHIAMSSNRALDGSDAGNTSIVASNVWVIDGDGMHLTALTQQTSSMQPAMVPAWSRDGTKIAYLQTLPVNAVQLWVMNADGSDAHVVVATQGGTTISTPVWSPDGTRLAFSSTLALDGSPTSAPISAFNIWVVGADGNNLVDVTATTAAGAHSLGPVWSPDNLRLAFYSLRAIDGSDAKQNTNNVWTANPGGGGLVTVTNYTTASAASPDWSPDGTQLVYASNGASNGTDTVVTQNIWVASPGGSDAIALAPITALGTSQSGPTWSPDGGTIMFHSQRALDGSDAKAASGVFNLWLMSSDGSNPRAITTGTAAATDSLFAQWPRI